MTYIVFQETSSDKPSGVDKMENQLTFVIVILLSYLKTRVRIFFLPSFTVNKFQIYKLNTPRVSNINLNELS